MRRLILSLAVFGMAACNGAQPAEEASAPATAEQAATSTPAAEPAPAADSTVMQADSLHHDTTATAGHGSTGHE